MVSDTKKPLRIYQCEDNTDGILSAIYEAGISKYGHDYIRIEPLADGQGSDMTLFSEYFSVETDAGKAEKVVNSVRNRISYRAYRYMMYAVAAADADRADAVYQFLTFGFHFGDKICDMLQFPPVKRVFELQRAVGNEAHFSREFLRFKQVEEKTGLMLAVLEPTHRILPMLAEHFHDRFPEGWFIIYDKTHLEALFHTMDGRYEIRLLTIEEAQKLGQLNEKKEEYGNLWKTFFHSIAIEERKNEKLQKSNMPLHYRKHVTEFLE